MKSLLVDPRLNCIFKCIYVITEDILWYQDLSCVYELSEGQ